jgi:tetratricopeptide (TPR) repeat protein
MQKERFYELLENPGLLDDKTLNELKEVADIYPFFHAGLVLYLKNLFVTGNSDFETILNRISVAIPDRKRLYAFLHAWPEDLTGDSYFGGIGTGHYQGQDRRNLTEDNLIDKFLSRERGPIKIENPDEGSSGDEDEILAKSVSENDELITETLAMIYFEQKKYDKAIDAFEKLRLKYPEKSVYFANRIEEIEKLKRI